MVRHQEMTDPLLPTVIAGGSPPRRISGETSRTTDTGSTVITPNRMIEREMDLGTYVTNKRPDWSPQQVNRFLTLFQIPFHDIVVQLPIEVQTKAASVVPFILRCLSKNVEILDVVDGVEVNSGVGSQDQGMDNDELFNNIPYACQVPLRSMHFQATMIAREDKVGIITDLMEDFAFHVEETLASMWASPRRVITEAQGEDDIEDSDKGSHSSVSGISNHLPHPNLTESLRRGTNRG
ncbi:hypothetical protein BDN71DRAFT_1513747 [Pleurotus eryngii]|uniref:Uncharacterized protein n=1 Tax=Pleurotus eryngii TaxID=5323 RepID=A0A9P6D9F4_PLEER|nr:hypothetical protein BDN71DRAFT_1513732 [Pleurotus eryngii]KAF9487673.1 hypothetical protein BDN71DRAFT_1513747 [Pleurotus eryngii]